MRFSTIFFLLLISYWTLGQSCALTVVVTGFKTNSGKAMLALHHKPEAFPNKDASAYTRITATIQNNTATFVLSQIPYGTYAIAVFHDENNNNKLDFSLIGYPSEKFGFSNNAKVTFAPPKWDEAKIVLQASTLRHSIVLQ